MGFGFFEDDKGNRSWLRLVGIAVFVTLCLCYFLLTVANIYVALTASPSRSVSMVDVTGGVLAFAGMVLAAKEVQKVIENKGPTTPLTP